jgi:hypothetical protein
MANYQGIIITLAPGKNKLSPHSCEGSQTLDLKIVSREVWL